MVRAELLALVLAGLVAVSSVYAIATPGVYDQETDAWAVQAVVQDWVNLVLLVPLLAATAIGSRRGSRVARLGLGGGLMYGVYNLVIYAFAVHFNDLFLVYTTGLGVGVFALIELLAPLARDDVPSWYDPAARVRFPAGLLVAFAAMFAVLWVTEILAALARGTPPESLEGTDLASNPVQALDLSVTLPTIALSGWWLWQRRRWGFILAPMTLFFAALTDVAIMAIILASRERGLGGDLGVAAGIGVALLLTLAALALLLRGMSGRRAHHTPQDSPEPR